MASLYDYPRYYDALFGWDRGVEADAYDRILRGHRVAPGGRVLEVACGTGRIARKLSRRGWQLTGLDLSSEMLDFLTMRSRDEKLTIDTVCADMCAFSAAVPQDAAVSPLSSFRLLLDDEAARAHLDQMASALVPGGIYVLDTAFGTSGAAEDDLEEWTMEGDGFEVAATPEAVRVSDRAQGVELTLDWHEQLRPYTAQSFEALVRSSALTLGVCYPEGEKNEDDVSRWAEEPSQRLPETGRAMVVLRNRGS